MLRELGSERADRRPKRRQECPGPLGSPGRRRIG